MHIIVKKAPSHSLFRPHYNRTMQKKYYTREEYMSDLKSKGLEPYDPKNVQTKKKSTYKPSSWAREIINSRDKKGKLGDRAIDSVRENLGYKPGYHDDIFAPRKLNNMDGGYVDNG